MKDAAGEELCDFVADHIITAMIGGAAVVALVLLFIYLKTALLVGVGIVVSWVVGRIVQIWSRWLWQARRDWIDYNGE